MSVATGHALHHRRETASRKNEECPFGLSGGSGFYCRFLGGVFLDKTQVAQ